MNYVGKPRCNIQSAGEMVNGFDQASVDALLEQAAEGLKVLEREYGESVLGIRPTPAFRVATLNHLVQHRAILDYLAHGLLVFCTGVPNKVYFPIAKPGMGASKFRDRVEKRWLPGLPSARPDIFEVLESVQQYRPGNEWITAFANMTNSNKHVRLSLMSIAGCDATVIGLPWGFGMQIGDRGFRKINLEGTAKLAFIGPQGEQLEIRGPETIDRNTVSLLNADPGISILNMKWQEFKFDEYPFQPAIEFLHEVNDEVKRIVDRLAPLLAG